MIERNRYFGDNGLNKRVIIITAILLAAITIIAQLCTFTNRGSTDSATNTAADKLVPGKYERIVSLAPNITETLFTLGLGNRLVGVSRFCKYPPEAQDIHNVGGFIDPNYEAIVRLKPDLVILLPEHENIRRYLDELGLETAVVHNRLVREILDTITAIGELCSVPDRAQVLVDGIETRMNRIREKTSNSHRPRVMISLGRTFGSTSVSDVSIAGKNTFYNELIAYAGGVNVYQKNDIPFPVLSKESILYLNPEYIIEMIPSTSEIKVDADTIVKEWDSIPNVDAVKHNRVYAFEQDYAVIPGPRFILFLEDLARTLHHELDWDD